MFVLNACTNQAQFKYVCTLLSFVSYKINTTYIEITFKYPSLEMKMQKYIYIYLHFVDLNYHSSLSNDIGFVLNNGA